MYDTPVVQCFSLRLQNKGNMPLRVQGIETKVREYWCMRPCYSCWLDSDVFAEVDDDDGLMPMDRNWHALRRFARYPGLRNLEFLDIYRVCWRHGHGPAPVMMGRKVASSLHMIYHIFSEVRGIRLDTV